MQSLRSLVQTPTSDIRIWLAVLFFIRLIGITNPPLDAVHGWRQAQTCMMARNMVEINANPFYPRIDQAGADKTGIVGSEFPLLPLTMYAVSKVTGYEAWYGRLINLLVTTLGLWFFYLLVLRWVNRPAAFASTLVLAASVWFMFGRKVMPDTFSISLVFGGLWFGVRFLDGRKTLSLFLFFVLMTLGGLSKLPAAAFYAVVPAAVFIRTFSRARFLLISGATALATICVLWWYFEWVPYLVQTFGFQIMFVQSLHDGFEAFIPALSAFAHKVYFETLQSYGSFVLALAGLVISFRNSRNLFYFLCWMLVPIVFFFLKAGGSVVSAHNYYMIPLAPVLALAAGWAIQSIPSGIWRTVVLVACISEALVNQQHDLRYPAQRAYKLQLEALADRWCLPGDGIAIVCDQNPTEFYCAHRKGWMLWPEEVSDGSILHSLAEKGCKLLVINLHNNPDLVAPAEMIFRNEHYLIYRLISQP